MASTPVSSMERECGMLSKLIYRNFNQHRKTKVFKSLHKVHQLMKVLLSIQLLQFGADTEQKLRLLQQAAKVSSRDFTACLRCVEIMHEILRMGTEAAQWLQRSGSLLREQLSILVFIPLYTTFLALVARTLRSLTTLLLQWETQLRTLQSRLHHVMAMNQRHQSDAAKAILRGTMLDGESDCSLVLQHLREIYGEPTTSSSSLSSSSSSSSSSGSLVGTVPVLVSVPVTVAVMDEDRDQSLNDSATGACSSSAMPPIGSYEEHGEEDMPIPVDIAAMIASNEQDNCELDEDFGEVVGSSAYIDTAVMLASIVAQPASDDQLLRAGVPSLGRKRPSSSEGGGKVKKKRCKDRQRDEIDDIFGGL